MFRDFFGRELQIGNWVLVPGYKGQRLILCQITEIHKRKVGLKNIDGSDWGGVEKTEKLVCVPEDLVFLYKLTR